MSTNHTKVDDIIIALRYCVSDNGEFCDMCPYAVFGVTCSKKLLIDASDNLKYFYKLRKDVV